MNKLAIYVDKKNQSLNEEILFEIGSNYPNTIIESDNLKALEFTVTDNQSLMDFVANKITNHIANNFDELIVSEVVNDECYDLLEDDIEQLVSEISEEYHKNCGLFQEIKKILTNEGSFNLMGYLNFRGKERELEIKNFTFSAVDDFFNGESFDFSNYINMIHKFIYIQKPKTEYVHIIEKENEEYDVITSNGETVDLKGLLEELQETNTSSTLEIGDLDLIVSCLLSMLPKKVILHFNQPEPNDISYVLSEIFEGRHEHCEGCEYCLPNEKEENEED